MQVIELDEDQEKQVKEACNKMRATSAEDMLYSDQRLVVQQRITAAEEVRKQIQAAGRGALDEARVWRRGAAAEAAETHGYASLGHWKKGPLIPTIQIRLGYGYAYARARVSHTKVDRIPL